MPKRLLILSIFIIAVNAQDAADKKPVYKVLFSPRDFTSPGANPSSIVEGYPGVLYVLGQRQPSAILSVTEEGASKLLYTFNTTIINTSLVQGVDGRLYGPSYYSALPQTSYGFYFSLDRTGANYRQLLLPGQYPHQWGSGADTIAAPPSALYDVVGKEASDASLAEAFARIGDDGKFTVLHKFSAKDGYPSRYSFVVNAPDGNFYGIGKDKLSGMSPSFVFRLTPTGEYARIVDLPKHSQHTFLPFIAASDGNLYGSFTDRGANGRGEIYQVTPTGKFQTMASFPATGLGSPWTLMQAADGNLYGTTDSDANLIFRYDMTTHALSPVYHLNGSGGVAPLYLMQGMSGKLFGVSPGPGTGVVFSLDIGLPRPKPVVSQMVPASAPVGGRVLLWGNYLLTASAVSFNGVPVTTLEPTSANSVWVTVPARATTGPVTVTTRNGTFTTSQSFTVQ